MNENTRSANYLLFLSITIVLFPMTKAGGQINTKVDWWGTSGGFDQTSWANSMLVMDIGQSFVGRSTASNTVIESGFLANPAFRTLATTIVTVGVPVSANWNIVSLPVSNPVSGDSVRQVFTNSVNANAFVFQGGYVSRFVLTHGPGYWIKSSIAYTQNIAGTLRDTLTIPVAPSWNMIGGISTAIDTSAAYVTPSVPGLRVSSFFGFNNGYQPAATIEPGKGYWVKAAPGGGTFFLHAPAQRGDSPAGQAAAKRADDGAKTQSQTSDKRSIDDLNTLTIRDANGGEQVLYFGTDASNEIPVAMFDMPPPPPSGSFDARFTSNEGGTMVHTHPAEIAEMIEYPITIQSSAYPLTVSWKLDGTDVSYEINNGDGKVQPLSGEGTLRITNSEVNHITLRAKGNNTELPKAFELSQNYPNPFNPSTTIKYALPRQSHVVLTVYNILGQEVARLVDEVQDAGVKYVVWNATSLSSASVASGVYFYRIEATSSGRNDRFVQMKKLMVLK